jgi:hypothetical protein
MGSQWELQGKMEPDYDIEDVAGGVPLKMWTRGVPVEAEAKQQLANAARLPIVFKHIAAMPDVHFGIGATVGSVIPTLKAIIPAAVGVDIGCGMMACSHFGRDVFVTRKGAVSAGAASLASSRAAWVHAATSCAARATPKASKAARTEPAAP